MWSHSRIHTNFDDSMTEVRKDIPLPVTAAQQTEKNIANHWLAARLLAATVFAPGLHADVNPTPGFLNLEAQAQKCTARVSVVRQLYEDINRNNQFDPNTDRITGVEPNKDVLVRGGGFAWSLTTNREGIGVFKDPQTGRETPHVQWQASCDAQFQGKPALRTLVTDLSTKNTIVFEVPHGTERKASLFVKQELADQVVVAPTRLPEGARVQVTPPAEARVTPGPGRTPESVRTPQPQRTPEAVVTATAQARELATEVARAQATATAVAAAIETRTAQATQTALATRIITGTPEARGGPKVEFPDVFKGLRENAEAILTGAAIVLGAGLIALAILTQRGRVVIRNVVQLPFRATRGAVRVVRTRFPRRGGQGDGGMDQTPP